MVYQLIWRVPGYLGGQRNLIGFRSRTVSPVRPSSGGTPAVS